MADDERIKDANLASTAWVTAGDVHAGDWIVDWHDENGRGVFNMAPRACKVIEATHQGNTMMFRFTHGRVLHRKDTDQVEVQL